VGTALIVSKTLALLERGEACAWITVARTAGSAPREVGARMVVTRDAAFDTIGGGQLEYRAIEIARALLQNPASVARLERFPLSARVGQCCGGTVWLRLKPFALMIFPGYAMRKLRSNRVRPTRAPAHSARKTNLLFGTTHCAKLRRRYFSLAQGMWGAHWLRCCL
jgi:xanthine/CO dehydrogenase XdhC/CoxF family maturation factor